MNKYLIFRTDRIGDFLITLILVKSIKRNDPKSIIKIVASKKNFNYIKSFNEIDNVFLLENNFFNKIKLIKLLRKDSYHAIIVHDSKKRSKFISFFLKKNIEFKSNSKSIISYIDEVKQIIGFLNLKYHDEDLNSLDFRDTDNFINLEKNFILFHFDEKWIHSEYILKYTNIEPDINQLIFFINSISDKSKKKIIVTSGTNAPKILNDIFSNNSNDKVKFLLNLSFIEIENLVSKADLLISCHGAISHVAAAKNVKQLDIIDESMDSFYKKWTKHFRNYNSVYRKNFTLLTKDILEKL